MTERGERAPENSRAAARSPEIMARMGKEPGEHYREFTAEFGAPCYKRIDAPATAEQ